MKAAPTQAQIDADLGDALQSLGRSIDERDAQLIALRKAAPLRSKGHAVEDAGHLPLFIAADEPGLML